MRYHRRAYSAELVCIQISLSKALEAYKVSQEAQWPAHNTHQSNSFTTWTSIFLQPAMDSFDIIPGTTHTETTLEESANLADFDSGNNSYGGSYCVIVWMCTTF